MAVLVQQICRLCGLDRAADTALQLMSSNVLLTRLTKLLPFKAEMAVAPKCSNLQKNRSKRT